MVTLMLLAAMQLPPATPDSARVVTGIEFMSIPLGQVAPAQPPVVNVYPQINFDVDSLAAVGGRLTQEFALWAEGRCACPIDYRWEVRAIGGGLMALLTWWIWEYRNKESGDVNVEVPVTIEKRDDDDHDHPTGTHKDVPGGEEEDEQDE